MTEYAVGVKVTGDAAGLAKAAKEAKKTLDTLGATGVKGLGLIDKGIKQTETSLQSMSTRTRSEFARMAQARETLGLRSERRIQQEIQRTQAAYQRLTSSGTMSWREQRRAAAQMRETVAGLNAEMGRYSLRQRAFAGAQRGGLLVAGLAAGAAVVAPKVGRAFDYDLSLANMANTAYGDPSLPAAVDRKNRIEGKAKLDAAIRDAIRYGGGTVEGASGTLNSLVSGGEFDPKDLLTIFREAQRAATANDASGQDFAQMASSAKATFGIAPKDMARMFGIATYGGQKGAFEIKDMARYLPAEMANAKQLGMSGISSFAELVALNQAARLTAGTSDAAGINVTNLLTKMGSNDTRETMAKLGINYDKRKAEGRMHGRSALDVTADIIDEQLAKNKNYRAAQRALATAGNDTDRKAALGAVKGIAASSTISGLFRDQQALLALIGYIGNRGMVGEIQKGALASGADAVNRNMWTIQGSPSYKLSQAAQTNSFMNYDAMMKLGPAVSTVAQNFSDLAQKYPDLAAAASGATTALQGLAVAGGVIGMGGLLLGGAKMAGRGGLVRGAWNAGARGAGAAARGVGTMAEIAAEVAAAGAGTGLAAGAGLVAMPLAGAYAYNQMTNTEGGLRARIADRNARIKEYDQMIAAERDQGYSPTAIDRLQRERAGVVESRDDMMQRLQAFLANAKVGGEINVNVTAAPGVSATTELKPNDGTRMTGNVGRTNVNTD